jgi:hypothetical protein
MAKSILILLQTLPAVNCLLKRKMVKIEKVDVIDSNGELVLMQEGKTN